MGPRCVRPFVIQRLQTISKAIVATAGAVCALRFGFITLLLPLSAGVASCLSTVAEIAFSLSCWIDSRVFNAVRFIR